MALPTGAITLLFSDIEGSTQRWEERPEAMVSALHRHDRLLRGAIEANRGYIFKTVGDAFCAAFSDPVDGVAAAERDGCVGLDGGDEGLEVVLPTGGGCQGR